jgi:hypothetical protein
LFLCRYSNRFDEAECRDYPEIPTILKECPYKNPYSENGISRVILQVSGAPSQGLCREVQSSSRPFYVQVAPLDRCPTPILVDWTGRGSMNADRLVRTDLSSTSDFALSCSLTADGDRSGAPLNLQGLACRLYSISCLSCLGQRSEPGRFGNSRWKEQSNEVAERLFWTLEFGLHAILIGADIQCLMNNLLLSSQKSSLEMLPCRSVQLP